MTSSQLTLDAAHIVLVAAALGLVALAFWLRSELQASRAAASARGDADARDAARLQEELQSAREEAKTQRLRAEEAERGMAGLKALQGEIQKQFGDLAQGVLERSQKQFLTLANETFAKHQEGARGDLQKLMTPVSETFSEFRKRVEAIEKIRAEDRSALQEQVKAIGESLQSNTRATGKLVNALSSPRGGGAWGEESLRNVMELAGMTAHADFVEQPVDSSESGRIRPDVVIRMPGGREIVVDAKVSLEDYLKACDEPDEAARQTYLAAHARKLRDHAAKLGRKDYWRQFDQRVDFVAMYVPGEQFYSAAVEIDRDLFEFAARNKVIIVTPSTLIALAKAVAYGWRQEEAAANARQAAELGRQLYDSLVAMGGHIEKTGKSIAGAMDSYNKMVGSLERNVMPKARKFEELQVAGDTGKALPRLEGVDEPVRLPSRAGELDFGGEAA